MSRTTGKLTSDEVRDWTVLLQRMKEGEVAGFYASTNKDGRVWVDIPEERSRQKIGTGRNTTLDNA